MFFKSISLTLFRSLSCLCFVTVNFQMTEKLQTILSRKWFNSLQIVERVGGAVFRLDLQKLLLGQNYILTCQWSSTLAMNRNLMQRKSTVVAAGCMITHFAQISKVLPQMLASGEHQLHCHLEIRKLFLEFLAPEPYWV